MMSVPWVDGPAVDRVVTAGTATGAGDVATWREQQITTRRTPPPLRGDREPRTDLRDMAAACHRFSTVCKAPWQSSRLPATTRSQNVTASRVSARKGGTVFSA